MIKFSKLAKKKSKTGPKVDPEYLKKQKESLLRKNRQVLCLNDQEVGAINLYCKKFGVKSKATFLREAIMEKVFRELEEHYPTLF